MSIEPFIKCSDLSRSLSFYTDTLDFIVRIATDPDPAAFMSNYALIERDGCLVHLSAHASDGAFGSLNYIRVDNIDELYQQLIERGLNILHPDTPPALTIKLVEQSWGMKEFSVVDPDKNKLTFGQQLA